VGIAGMGRVFLSTVLDRSKQREKMDVGF